MNEFTNRLFAGLICLAAFNFNVFAGTTFVTGNEIHQDMKDNYGRLYSLGYITGIADVGNGNSIDGFKFCIPALVTQGQLSDIVSKWLDQNPEKRHYSASILIASVFQESFPCK